MDSLLRVSVLPRKQSLSMVKGPITSSVFIATDTYTTADSVLPAISLDGILNVEVVEGSYGSDSFARFIGGLLYHMNPFPGPNTVIIMGNCRNHRSDLVREIIEGW
jgi:hypothetical protein